VIRLLTIGTRDIDPWLACCNNAMPLDSKLILKELAKLFLKQDTK
jgi:hypothetical protein